MPAGQILLGLAQHRCRFGAQARRIPAAADLGRRLDLPRRFGDGGTCAIGLARRKTRGETSSAVDSVTDEIVRKNRDMVQAPQMMMSLHTGCCGR
jgi:hypothetical protein